MLPLVVIQGKPTRQDPGQRLSSVPRPRVTLSRCHAHCQSHPATAAVAPRGPSQSQSTIPNDEAGSMTAPLRTILLAALVGAALAAEESCVGRCENGFNPLLKCQCDDKCRYYSSCCSDYDATCGKTVRGDKFADEDNGDNSTISTPSTTVVADTTAASLTQGPTKLSDLDAAICSGEPFDAFMQLKNGSTYGFRGEYFFELDEKAAGPGYPKLIEDVWGIPGPIDAAFTRVNCQGKTYIFKGNKYWRFEGNILDEDYPRDISEGFETIPDDIDAAFAIPALDHHGKEKVYFFKGDRYYQYEFKHQPSHGECVEMFKASPSLLFTRYTDLYCNDFEDLLATLLGGSLDHHQDPRLINKDWKGIEAPVDAVMAGQIFLSPVPSTAPSSSWPRSRTRKSSRRHRKNKHRKSKKNKKHHRSDLYRELYDYSYRFLNPDYDDDDYEVEGKTIPVQKIYFFKKDKYYKVDFQTRRMDTANPPYPRSIAKYWLGCKEKADKE
ncbi:vitronectin-like [Arapaima gigas]